MPIEIREITISAQLHPQSKRKSLVQRGKRRAEEEEALVQEIAERVLEVIERKGSR